MRFAVASLLALAIATVATPASAHRCAVGSIEVPPARIDAILQEPDVNRQIDLMAGLGNYWMVHCASGRQNARPAVVREIARLLAAPETRFLAATMLVDVGHNLKRVRPDLEVALTDERARHERALRANFPWVPNHHRLTALECVERKLLSGEIDQELCGGVLGARGRDGLPTVEWELQ